MLSVHGDMSVPFFTWAPAMPKLRACRGCLAGCVQRLLISAADGCDEHNDDSDDKHEDGLDSLMITIVIVMMR